MIRQYELVERVKAYNPGADEALLNRAYVYAMQAHGSQTRASGDPYFSHPLEVAAILAEFHLDDATIVAALLHDTIEDTSTTRAEIDELFGPSIGRLVEGLTKLRRIDLVSKQAAQAENLRKLLLAIAEDVRVLLVKLADRLHNMRTLQFVPEEKRNRVAEETLDIYAPLAGRMGMQEMREELEELSFRQLFPEAHATITQRLEALKARSVGLIEEIEKALREKLAENGLECEIHSRQKRAYSIWRKMDRKAIAFEQLSDVIGFRVIAPSVAGCYRALGVVHTSWPVVPLRFKDYISTPKQNDYRSLHTTVVGPGHQRVELQIRTDEMDRVAEYGIAAHALYKDEVGGDRERIADDSRAYEWLRRTVALLAEGDSPEEFLEHTKLELFQDQVFCFTPKGRLIALPRGATAIDFAYAVHTDVGNTCVGCKINGRIAPLVSELTNGDEVEIVRAEGQRPPAAWEALVTTGKARAAIRRATRAAVREQYADFGRRIVVRAFERAGLTFAEDELKEALPRLARNSVEDVLAAVGRGEMPSVNVLRAVHPERDPSELDGARRRRRGPARWLPGGIRVGSKSDGMVANSLPIRGLKRDVSVRFAPNGGALPGDRIVGILTPGEGVTIYPIQSPALKEFETTPERWLDVQWDAERAAEDRFPCRLEVTSLNEPGTLAGIAKTIAEEDGNIENLVMAARSPDFHEMIVDLTVHDLKHLTAIIRGLKRLRSVSSVARVNG
ncbi:MAG TPA: bifunctional (p)ppGpp synthetase/guanosine-3',5'-bis(diphosphate) 3'-pyrophosphohydrolase [Hyphomicrobiales bacterium]|nr:bifunctional (p)ppGpp synthetase/guanosine-3',5'-bis(diphosphate) 3'-pyrophosphohydrolase [Hyphomicrobiales bacterium]